LRRTCRFSKVTWGTLAEDLPRWAASARAWAVASSLLVVDSKVGIISKSSKEDSPEKFLSALIPRSPGSQAISENTRSWRTISSLYILSVVV